MTFLHLSIRSQQCIFQFPQRFNHKFNFWVNNKVERLHISFILGSTKVTANSEHKHWLWLDRPILDDTQIFCCYVGFATWVCRKLGDGTITFIRREYNIQENTKRVQSPAFYGLHETRIYCTTCTRYHMQCNPQYNSCIFIN